jgi:methyl-accepting chemotaxis protein
MASNFSLRLTHKIMAIGIVGLAGLLAFGAIYQVGSWSQDTSRSVANNARTIFDLNKQLSIEMLEARRNEKNFQQRRNESYAKAHAELVVVIDRNFDRLEALTKSSGLGSILEKVKFAHDGFKRYSADFAAQVSAEIKLGLNETLGLSGSLRAAVHDIEASLKEIDDPRLTIGMQVMHRHEKDFMLRRDQRYVDEMKTSAAEFIKTLSAVAITPPVMAGINSKLENYLKAFAAWVETAQQTAAYDASMMNTFRAFEPLMVEITQGVERIYKEADAAEAATRDSVKQWLVIAFVLSIVLVFGLSRLIGRSISKALASMASAMTRLAGGDFKIVTPGLGRKDEIGEMAGAVQVFKNNMIETERMRAEQSQAAQLQSQQRKADMNKIADGFESAVGEIIEAVSSASIELEASAGTLSSTAERAQEITTMVAAASEEASTNVQSVASATEELSSSVNEISRQVQESARVANEAVGQARATNDRVGQLSKAAARIGDVVELINSIASQTNLLALNATIEAARAGEAGRGFAVVASEVKALAEQTAKATGEIGQQVAGIQAATEESVGAIREISGTIERLSEISSTIAAAVEEQGATTQEISRNVQQAAQGTTQVSSNIADVQRGAGETGSASSQVLSAAQSLSNDSNRLKLEVGKFLDSVRAA